MSMIRTAFASTTPAVRGASRAFHVSPIAGKTVTEKVKEVAHEANLKVGRGLASAIEKGEEATEKLVHVAPALGKAKATAEQASEKASQTSADVRERARDFKEDVEKEAQK
ncbi:uncharacterized protein LAESUDRAFT_726049 [Laetiporus sulphureus 93-53]|uniref:Uncharacterized protein n=1 Tax=Laetiporus sulphureus 93-53 TaxID=1314785 RepID=A0A165E4P3_9APHY|nr:uncharacterized protein LAESUDRAFT_726049 [Laetiporus sulphureus 93-53]KZT06234.1 hypothetical protein LAESUDRAFT_726049 [Laetiporus sulphureus 93-53]